MSCPFVTVCRDLISNEVLLITTLLVDCALGKKKMFKYITPFAGKKIQNEQTQFQMCADETRYQ